MKARKGVATANNIRRGNTTTVALFIVFGIIIQTRFLRRNQALPLYRETTMIPSNETVSMSIMHLPASQRLWQPDELPDIPQLIKDYETFHNDRVVQLQDGTYGLKDPNTRFLAYSCRYRCGGLGDRIKAIFSLFYIAICSDRVLIIDELNPYPLRDFLSQNRIHWDITDHPLASVSLNLIDYKLKGVMAKTNQLRRFLNKDIKGIKVRYNMFTFRKDQYSLFETNLPECTRQIVNESKAIGGEQYYEDVLFRWAFWTLFRFNDTVLERANEIQEEAGLVVSEPYLSVHVRTGVSSTQTWNDPERHWGNDTLQTFLNCARRIQRQIPGDMPIPIYVASDNSDAKSILQSWDETVKITQSFEPVHIDRSNLTQITDPFASLVDVWAEFVVLVDSECIVRSRSGFSEVAYAISLSRQRAVASCGVMFGNCTEEDVQEALEMLQDS